MKDFIIEYKEFICELDDFNYENKNERIVFIYKNMEDFENGDYLEQVSLLNKNIKENIIEYLENNYDMEG